MANKEYRDKTIIRKRMVIVLAGLSFLFILLFSRMFYVMVVQSSKYKAYAVDQWTSEVKIAAKRGRILDRNGNELAVSANVYRVDLDMNTLRDTMKTKNLTVEEVSAKLAGALKMETADVTKILSKTLPSGLPIGSATLKRRIEKPEADSVKALNLRGVLVSADTKRFYPNNNFLAQVLGHTNSDGDGLTGVELKYNKELSGTPGVRIAETDRKSMELPNTISEYTEPVDGRDLVLTIDEMIQNFAEKAAAKALEDNKAKAVSIIVMDPKNGDVLAMVNKPDYNPNDPWVEGKTSDELQQMWRNRAVSDTFEPGSIFKVITSTAALETGSVTDNDTFTCTGSFSVGGRIIHCWKRTGHGTQHFVDILKNSCNVGFAAVGKKVGRETLNEYIQKFGFGKKTGIDLPGEASGIIKKTADITETDLATISFGQTDTVSCIQYLTAFNAVANGGKLITPHLMKEIAHYDEDSGKEIADSKYDSTVNSKQILDSAKMSELRGYLEKVVGEGGGSKAFIEGYHIAGKTGTAQKAGPGGYQSGKYIASFTGMAPASDPRITVFISIDEPDPSNYYAGQIAAPVAQQVFNDIFNYLAMKSDASGADVARSLLRDVVVPDVRGMTKADAQKVLKEQHLAFDIDSTGPYITDMNPKPGYTVKEGSKITLYTGTAANYNKVVAVPNIKGLTQERAVQVLNSVGLKASSTGSGMVSGQSIAAGTEVSKGTTVTMDLEPIGD